MARPKNPNVTDERRARNAANASKRRIAKRAIGIKPVRNLQTEQAYRDKNREKIRVYLNQWRLRKRREAGIGPRNPAMTPEEYREYQRQWRLAHPGAAAAYTKKWRDNNLEKREQYQAEYNLRNRERKRLYAQQRRRARGVKPMKRGKMSRAEEGRLYRERHPEQIREKERRYRKNNPEAYRQKARIDTGRRRIRKAKLPGSHTGEQWLLLCAKFKWRCVCCGVHNLVSTLARDHIIPITNLLSTDDISNIQPLCQPCNSSKGNKHTIDYRNTPFRRQGQAKLF